MIKKILVKLITLNRISKQLILIFIDSFLVIFALIASFSLRLGYLYLPQGEILWITIGAPIIAIPILIGFRLYNSVIRYIGVKSLWSITKASSFYALIWGLMVYMASIAGVPRSVIFINIMLTIGLLWSIRILARWIFTHENLFTETKKTNIIIYGAGSAGRQLSQALKESDEYRQIAYIDDNLYHKNTYINDIPVFPFNKISSLIENNNISEVLLAVPTISRKRKQEIIENLKKIPISYKSLPSVSEIAEGKVQVNDLLKIDIKDLLGRDMVQPNVNLLKTNITNKVVLVTGAGGSIGSELCRQIIFLKPTKLILFDLSETLLYEIEQEILQIADSNTEIIAVLGSVLDKNRLEAIFKRFSVQTIYHAAAYKHVPLVEFNMSEGVLNNSIGTLIIAEAAINMKVETFVLISTDKAVRPTNIMGATKRVAELILQALDKENHSTCFSMVRFGNVLNSSGSVIRTFKKQIASGGPVTVTHKDIVRYFMTIPEAVELVIQAGAMSKGGDVFVLEMGEPVRIYDLALKVINLSGLTLMDKDNPDGDIEIKYTGLRPGEKLYEETLVDLDAKKTDNELILTANESMLDWQELKTTVEELHHASLNSNHMQIRELLIKLVPEYKPEENISDVLYEK